MGRQESYTKQTQLTPHLHFTFAPTLCASASASASASAAPQRPFSPLLSLSPFIHPCISQASQELRFAHFRGLTHCADLGANAASAFPYSLAAKQRFVPNKKESLGCSEPWICCLTTPLNMSVRTRRIFSPFSAPMPPSQSIQSFTDSPLFGRSGCQGYLWWALIQRGLGMCWRSESRLELV